MRVWKWIGVAGVAGVAATGAVIARNERQRRSYTPDDVRTRLHERAAEVADTPAVVEQPAEKGYFGRLLHRLRRQPRTNSVAVGADG